MTYSFSTPIVLDAVKYDFMIPMPVVIKTHIVLKRFCFLSYVTDVFQLESFVKLCLYTILLVCTTVNLNRRLSNQNVNTICTTFIHVFTQSLRCVCILCVCLRESFETERCILCHFLYDTADKWAFALLTCTFLIF